METIRIPGLEREVSRVGLGTWAIGGWMWGGTDREESIRTIHSALDRGLNLIDTAPVYGFGTSESIVGEALERYGQRDEVVIATKVGLEWQADDKVFRNTTPERIKKEVEDSLKRLKTETIDLYQVHWPDSLVPFEETARAMNDLYKAGKVKAVGVSNFTPEQMDAFRKECPLHTNQPPYNLFERQIDEDVIPYTRKHGIALVTYGALCRGLLSGKMSPDTRFEGDDLRKVDPKFQQPRYDQYLTAVSRLDDFARENYGKRVLHLAVRWILDRGVEVALWGARRPDQLEALADVDGWKLDDAAMKKIDEIVSESVRDPVGPEFMAAPLRDSPSYKGENPVS